MTRQDKETRRWQQRPHRSLYDQTVLLLGTGKMAQGVAQLLAALGANIIGANSSGRINDSHFQRCMTMGATKEVASSVSCIINTLPLHKQTQRLVDLSWLSHFHEALLINVGRGGTTETDDLQQALKERYLAYAVLDVFDHEPLPQDSWLWQHPQIFISPHQAAVTDIDDIVTSFAAALRVQEQDQLSDAFANLSKGY